MLSEPQFHYPPDLPVTGHRTEILDALRRHPVVIVCGDTGSGKTTQLPKMAMEAAAPGASHRRIAVTQPRRLAAVTMAERVAEELHVPVGGLVGFRHRFERRLSADTRIEFMTDGVLLAETRCDQLLRGYDTVIVDEAHERSLNIDFLLGILKRILTRRRDLTVVVSSATLDVERFAAFFDGAPVISVPGRLFPIEIGYRPPPEAEERDLPRDVAAAVAELPAHDDILVFLPGERDIRETADLLNDVRGGFDDIIPLLASLPAAEQRRAFRPSPRRRIVLATNVAETSVTIPGIRAVVDSGLARISRYVHRTQVQRLQIEPISQASARQRAGRCGRLGPGTCLRLYSAEDFAGRDGYTAPEVLRTSLAGVILTMLDLGLGDIAEFPFIDPPKPTMIREGLRELLELGAIAHAPPATEGGPRAVVLTDIGRKLAKLPVEPRLARMLIAGSRYAVLADVLPLVAAMACDDPRRRPLDEMERADQAHAPFRVPGSDFLGTLKLWRWWDAQAKELSQTRARRLCKQTYLSYPKMREWRDLTRQLEGLCAKLGLAGSGDAGGPDGEDGAARVHLSLLTGLLGRIGRYDEESRDYRGANGLRFAIHPGSVLAKALRKAPGRRPQNPPGAPRPSPAAAFPTWIMAGELVDTSRLFARDAATIDVRWIEPAAGSLCKHSYRAPEWDPRDGFVRATEQVTLHGLVIVPARRCDYSRIDPKAAREIFIRAGLIDGEFPRPPPEVRANQALLDALRRRAERSRRPDVFDADRIFAHFDRILPADVCSAGALRTWLRRAAPADFTLKKTDWWPRETEADRSFPDVLRIAGKKIRLTYRHTPDDPEHDGITATVRPGDEGVLRLWRDDWLVPGLLPEKIGWMLGTLPSALRRALSPIDDSATILLSMLKPGSAPLEDAVRTAVRERWGFRIPAGAWDWEKLPAHLKVHFTGAAKSVAARPCTSPRPARHETTWLFGDLPERSVDRNAGWETVSYGALRDEGDGVTLARFAHAETAAEAHAAGVTRLLYLALAKTVVPFRRSRAGLDAALYLKEIDYADDAIAADLLYGAVRETLVRNRPPVRTQAAFAARLAEDRAALVRTQAEMTQLLVESAAAATRLYAQIEDARLPEATADSVTTQLAWLLPRGFPRNVPLATLRHYRRYLKGAQIRLERARLSPAADARKEALFAPHWQRYRENPRTTQPFLTYRWMLEEYRVSLFAQELHTPEPVSPKRLDAAWETAVRSLPPA